MMFAGADEGWLTLRGLLSLCSQKAKNQVLCSTIEVTLSKGSGLMTQLGGGEAVGLSLQ